jgi:hypothetical protein
MRDAAMAAEPFAQGIRERDDHERQRGYRENGVRHQKRKIYRPDPALSPETDNTRVHVKINVEAKERDRAEKRAQHGRPVPADFSVANERQSNKEKKRTNPVERGVDGGKR